MTSVEGSNRLATGTLEEEIAVDLELVETRTFGATVYLHYRRRG